MHKKYKILWKIISPLFIQKRSMSVLVAFDFDYTITDDNTDTVARNLLPPEKLTDDIKKLAHSHGWTKYMGKIMELLHANSIDVKQIENAIVNIPAVRGIEELLREFYSHGYEIIIISDSNSIFIDTWLKSRKLDNVITKVFTNPARIDSDGMMKVEMYHVQDTCKLSEVNLCKGQILEDYIKKRSKEGLCFKRVIYIGDGKNDLCPVLRLSENDIAFPRINYTLMKLLNNRGSQEIPPVKAEIIPWNDGTDILQKLNEKIRTSDNST